MHFLVYLAHGRLILANDNRASGAPIDVLHVVLLDAVGLNGGLDQVRKLLLTHARLQVVHELHNFFFQLIIVAHFDVVLGLLLGLGDGAVLGLFFFVLLIFERHIRRHFGYKGIMFLVEEVDLLVEYFHEGARVNVANYLARHAALHILVLVVGTIDVRNVIIDVGQNEPLTHLAAHGIVEEGTVLVDRHDLLVEANLSDEVERSVGNSLVLSLLQILIPAYLLKFSFDLALMVLNELAIILKRVYLATVVHETVAQLGRLLEELGHVNYVLRHELIVLVEVSARFVHVEHVVRAGQDGMTVWTQLQVQLLPSLVGAHLECKVSVGAAHASYRQCAARSLLNCSLSYGHLVALTRGGPVAHPVNRGLLFGIFPASLRISKYALLEISVQMIAQRFTVLWRLGLRVVCLGEGSELFEDAVYVGRDEVVDQDRLQHLRQIHRLPVTSRVVLNGVHDEVQKFEIWLEQIALILLQLPQQADDLLTGRQVLCVHLAGNTVVQIVTASVRFQSIQETCLLEVL